jgi:fructokinase
VSDQGAGRTGRLYGGIEAGGTKFVCVVGTGPDDIQARTRIDTTLPGPTLDTAVEFFRDVVASGADIAAIGIASFGPIELRPGHPDYGSITHTPKPDWSGTDMVGPFAEALGVPVGFDTDVNGAALAEGRWGAARGLGTFVYVTVGTGIGGGVVANGGPVHGLVHPEIGHVFVPRVEGDTFPGSCPYHGDCLEGMASGFAMQQRWGRRAEELEDDEFAVALATEASYLASGFRNIVYAIAPERIVFGGGVSEMPGLLPRVRAALTERLGGYPGLPEHDGDGFVVSPALGGAAGSVGSLVLATRAWEAAAG